MSEPQSPSKKSFFGLGKEKKEGSGLKTPTHEVSSQAVDDNNAG